jgi:hypothetical protein
MSVSSRLEELESRTLLSLEPLLWNGAITINPTNEAQTSSSRAVGIVYGHSGAGTGTLIAPDWVLTAAHVVLGSAANGVVFDVGGTSEAVTSVQWFIAPGYQGSSGGTESDADAHFDLALVHLSRQVSDAPWIPLDTGGVGNGEALCLAGFGVPYPGPQKSPGDFGTKRWGISHISGYDYGELKFELYARGDLGGDPFGGGKVAPSSQVMSGHGDSGGPELAYTTTTVQTWAGPVIVNAFRIAGVTVAGADDGSETIGTWVSPFLSWIQNVTGIATSVPTASLPFNDGVIGVATSRDGSSSLVLEQNGVLWHYDGFVWSVIDQGVTSFKLAPDGTLYDLHAGESGAFFYWSPGTGLALIDTGVQSFALGTANRVYYLKDTDQSIYAFTEGGAITRQTLAYSVQSFAMTAANRIYFLNAADQSIYAFTEGGAITRQTIPPYRVLSFALGVGNRIYLLNSTDQSVYSFIEGGAIVIVSPIGNFL